MPGKKTSAARGAKPDAEEGTAGARPRAWVPTWEVPVILKSADLAMKGGEKLLEWIKSEGPLLLQILDSRALGEKYEIELRATNMTVHGIYVDSFTLLAPVELELAISPKRLTVGFDEASAPSLQTTRPRSTLIRPGASMEFTIAFPVPAQEDLRQGWFKNEKRLGSGRLNFLILNEEERRAKEARFSIRLS